MSKIISILKTFIICFLIWAGGFLWFVSQIASSSDAELHVERMDAIIVLTGGSERLQQGFDLLHIGLGKHLLITGVGKNITLPMLLKSQTKSASKDYIAAIIEQSDNITLDYNAVSTRGNAIETSRWMQEQAFSSMWLVTASYHMPRSLLEFKNQMPNKIIMPSNVFPSGFKRDNWWRHKGTILLIINEYHKYISVKMRGL